jgi:hypothetical protein
MVKNPLLPVTSLTLLYILLIISYSITDFGASGSMVQREKIPHPTLIGRLLVTFNPLILKIKYIAGEHDCEQQGRRE